MHIDYICKLFLQKLITQAKLRGRINSLTFQMFVMLVTTTTMENVELAPKEHTKIKLGQMNVHSVHLEPQQQSQQELISHNAVSERAHLNSNLYFQNKT